MAKYGMVIDLTRCGGCQTCVVTCQQHNNQKPGVAWIDLKDIEMGEWPNYDRITMPHACLHCDDAPCVSVCPTGASEKRESGIVHVDYETCISCGMCIEACPYDARTISPKESVRYFEAEEAAPYEAYGVQHADVAEKCMLCYERTESGEQTYCVQGCPLNARLVGDLDDPASEISKYIEESNAENIAGTSLYYVKGNHDFDLQKILVVNEAQAAEVEKVEDNEDEGINPVAAGVAGVAVLGAAAGVGYAMKKRSDNKAEDSSNREAGE